jgi:hypothetical protein
VGTAQRSEPVPVPIHARGVAAHGDKQYTHQPSSLAVHGVILSEDAWLAPKECRFGTPGTSERETTHLPGSVHSIST